MKKSSDSHVLPQEISPQRCPNKVSLDETSSLAPIDSNSLRLERLILCFTRCLGNVFDTQLVGGASEPIYVPKSKDSPSNTIFFSYDYFSSALHELSHWCLAGARRRTLEDYGYWYSADGRDDQQQALFEHVEVKPQAVEWVLSKSCGIRFRVSADNLLLGEGASVHFKKAVLEQVLTYCREGLPSRAETLSMALTREFSQAPPLHSENYSLLELDTWSEGDGTISKEHR